MLIVMAHNTTGTKADGTSDYDVKVSITTSPTSLRTIVKFNLKGHVRSQGGAKLLRLIADEWEKRDAV